MVAAITRELAMLKIYGRANSINVRKVLWIADEIGIPYTREDWGRGFRPLDDPAFAAVNPMQAIPVIDDDGVMMRESHVIVRYLADKHKRIDLYPSEARTRYEIGCCSRSGVANSSMTATIPAR